MTASSPRETAKIYTFQPRSRATTLGGKPGQPSAGMQSGDKVAGCDFGGGWYHEAAIRDSGVSRTS